MIERILIVTICIAAILSLRWYISWRTQRLRGEMIEVADVPLGQPAIIALTTDHCMQCERLQKPALQRLRAMHDDVAIIWRNVAHEPELVQKFGIMTVPSTVIRNADGTLRHINMGYADEHTLLAQLHTR